MQLSAISEEVKHILTENRRTVSGQQFTVPCTSHPNRLILESCFASLILKRFDPKSAEKEVISLLSSQLPEGKIPIGLHNQFTAPPLIAYSAFETFKSSGSEEFLEKVFTRLDRYYKWMSTIRDPFSKNILSIIHPDESGYCESQAWQGLKDANLLSSYKNIDCNDTLFLQRGYFAVKDVFFNFIYF